MMMMVPEPWGRNTAMSPERRAFYEYHSCLMEPWDGPASLAFTDGIRIGATLDRNGLRPGRYWVTCDGRVVVASEARARHPARRRHREGPPPAGEDVPGTRAGPDHPGRGAQGRDHRRRAVRGGSATRSCGSRTCPPRRPSSAPTTRRSSGARRCSATPPRTRMIVTPMATTGTDPVGSMGNDAPLAVLSEKPQLLYSYFKQLFAQVTNPPVDAIREEIIMATDRAIGPEENLLEPGPNARTRSRSPAGDLQLRAGADPALDGGPPRTGSGRSRCRSCSRSPTTGRACGARSRTPARGVRGDQRGLQPDHPVGPRPQRDRRADPRCSR